MRPPMLRARPGSQLTPRPSCLARVPTAAGFAAVVGAVLRRKAHAAAAAYLAVRDVASEEVAVIAALGTHAERAAAVVAAHGGRLAPLLVSSDVVALLSRWERARQAPHVTQLLGTAASAQDRVTLQDAA